MCKTNHIISIVLARSVAALPLSLVVGIMIAVPSSATAQVATCVDCVDSPFAPESTVCAFAFEGYQNCQTLGTPESHECEGYGGECDTEESGTADQEATAMVVRGDMLPADGNYFFMVEGAYSVVMRKCDGSVVARVPTGEALQQPSDRVVVGPHPHTVERFLVADHLVTGQ